MLMKANIPIIFTIFLKLYFNLASQLIVFLYIELECKQF